MKKLVIFCSLLSLVLAAKQYTNKYDNVNVDQILKNSRLLDNYLRCLLDLGRCTADAQELKAIVPDAITDGCGKCSEKQRETSEKVIRHLVKNRPKDWGKLLKKYDPQGIYKAKYEHLLNTEAN